MRAYTRAQRQPQQQHHRPAHRAAAPSSAAMRGGGGGSGGGRRRAGSPPPIAAAPPGAGIGADRPLTSPGGKPTLILDIMDTVVVDPFYRHMPAYFGLTFEELMALKHPTAWLDFERGRVDEAAFLASFFRDGRAFDGPGLARHMAERYEYVEGMPALLSRLRAAGHALHAMSNYPSWWRRVEARLRVEEACGVAWTFVSCEGPMRGLRKPEPECYAAVEAELRARPEQLIFVDDRAANVEAAAARGWGAVRFESAAQLEKELRARGVDF